MKFFILILLLTFGCDDYYLKHKLDNFYKQNINQELAINVHSKIDGTWKHLKGEYTKIIEPIYSETSVNGDFFNDKSYGTISVGSQYREVLGGFGAYRLFRIINDSTICAGSHTKDPQKFEDFYECNSFHINIDTLFYGSDTLIKTQPFIN